MEYKGMNLCDFCFEPVIPGAVCPKCGLTHETCKTEAGLLEPGTNLLGKYIIGRTLGRGGFGATYVAYSSGLDKRVAIKEYFPNGIAYRGKGEQNVAIVSNDKRGIFQKGAKRFFDEAKTMSKFNTNKNVVSVYEFFYANDTVYYSMEFLEGIDLKGYIEKKGRKLPEGEALTIMEQVLSALKDIHSTGTLHRDISPDNIFICTDGLVKLIDFGAAKQVVGEQSQNLSVILKQGFAPVEQYQKDGNQGMWTDIYALGATMYYAITGKVPDDAMSRIESPEIRIDPSLGISRRFEEVLNKCLRIKIDKRYQNALEVLDALTGIATPRVPVGGQNFVQSVYIGSSGPGIGRGNPVTFVSGGINAKPNTGYNPFEQPIGPSYPAGSMTGMQNIPPSGYPGSASYQMSGYVTQSQKKKSSLGKGVAIGVGAIAALVIVIFVIVKLMSPAPVPQGGPMPPPMGQPMQGQMGGPPPGQPMQQQPAQ